MKMKRIQPEAVPETTLKTTPEVKPSKRQRSVFPTAEIPHLWFHQTQSEARNPGRNLYFENDTIYSYGSHFPIARHVKNLKGESAVLFTVASYSVNTTRHISAVRQAIPDSTLVLGIPSMNTSTPNHTDNFKYLIDQANERIAKASRARSTWTITHNLGQANSLVESARAYGKFFRVRVPKLPIVPQADSEKLAAIGKREREESARKSKEQREQNEVRKARLYQERKLWEEGLPALCERWRKGENVNIPRPNYAWYDYDQRPGVLPTMLRVSGNEVETSLGARVPVSHAKRGLAFVRRVVVSGQEYVANSHTLHLGHYTIDRIEIDGTLHAGCHVIKFAEIESLAPALDAVSVSEVTASESKE